MRLWLMPCVPNGQLLFLSICNYSYMVLSGCSYHFCYFMSVSGCIICHCVCLWLLFLLLGESRWLSLEHLVSQSSSCSLYHL